MTWTQFRFNLGLMKAISLVWFRRDLRLKDNHALSQALRDRANVQPIFIFDTEILSKLEDADDSRVHFIHSTVQELKKDLQGLGTDLWVFHGKPEKVWRDLVNEHRVEAVYANRDYEPSALRRDGLIEKLLLDQGIPFLLFKDQCLFEMDEIKTGQGTPYTIYTPYKKKILATLSERHLKPHSTDRVASYHRGKPRALPRLSEMGFRESSWEWPSSRISRSIIETYDKTRDFPALEKGTSRLGLHLRFGTISIRDLAKTALALNETYLSELIWRDFFMQILWHFPKVEKQSFRPAYDEIKWRSSRSDFERWSTGQTGYPWVDAGMRQLNATGFMHNRVRMAVASFLSKHLLIHWLEGERYFARKLLDYDLSANNGNWQWAAGTGCDAAPYFRVFNPESQAKKFDKEEKYIREWVPDLGTSKYPQPMVDHAEARGRALAAYSSALKGSKS